MNFTRTSRDVCVEIKVRYVFLRHVAHGGLIFNRLCSRTSTCTLFARAEIPRLNLSASLVLVPLALPYLRSANNAPLRSEIIASARTTGLIRANTRLVLKRGSERFFFFFIPSFFYSVFYSATTISEFKNSNSLRARYVCVIKMRDETSNREM